MAAILPGTGAAIETMQQLAETLHRVRTESSAASGGFGKFVKELVGAGGVIGVFKLLIDKRRELSEASSKIPSLLPESTRIRMEMKTAGSAIEELGVKLAKLEYQRSNLRSPAEDVGGALQKELDATLDQYELQKSHLAALQKHLPEQELHEALSKHLTIAEGAKTGIGAIITEQLVSRWYSFNKAVQNTNASLADRRGLFALATDLSSKVGAPLEEVGDTLEVLRRRGLTMAASLDVGRKTLGDYSLKPLGASLEEVTRLSIRAHDALGLTPEDVGNLVAASQKLNQPFVDVLDTVTGISQQLGFSGQEAAKFVEQAADLGYQFNLSAAQAHDLADTLAQTQAIARGAGVTDQDFAAQFAEKTSDITSAAGGYAYAVTGGEDTLTDKGNKDAILAFSRQLHPLFDEMAKGGPGVGALRAQFNQMATTMGLTDKEAVNVIKTADRLNGVLGATAISMGDLDKVADSQLADTGQIWKRFGGQLLALISLGLTPLTMAVEALSKVMLWGYTAFSKIPGPLREVIKLLGAATASLLIFASATQLVSSLGQVFGSLNKAGGIGKLLGLGGLLGGKAAFTDATGAALVGVGGAKEVSVVARISKFVGLDVIKEKGVPLVGKITKLANLDSLKQGGSNILEYFAKAGTGLRDFLSKTPDLVTVLAGVQGSFSKLPTSVLAFLKPLGLVTKVFTFLPSMILNAAKTVPFLAGAIDMVTGALAGLGVVLETTPVGWIITALAALGVAFWAAYKYIKPFRELLDGLWEGIKAGLMPVFTGLGDVVKGVWHYFKELIGGTVDMIMSIPLVTPLVHLLGRAFGEGSNSMSIFAKAGRFIGIVFSDVLLAPLKVGLTLIDLLTGRWGKLHDLWLGSSKAAAVASNATNKVTESLDMQRARLGAHLAAIHGTGNEKDRRQTQARLDALMGAPWTGSVGHIKRLQDAASPLMVVLKAVGKVWHDFFGIIGKVSSPVISVLKAVGKVWRDFFEIIKDLVSPLFTVLHALSSVMGHWSGMEGIKDKKPPETITPKTALLPVAHGTPHATVPKSVDDLPWMKQLKAHVETIKAEGAVHQKHLDLIAHSNALLMQIHAATTEDTRKQIKHQENTQRQVQRASRDQQDAAFLARATSIA
jgi:hypothetical protein